MGGGGMARNVTGKSRATEDYLEAIDELIASDGAARVKNIAQRLGVARSTVSGALRALDQMGLVVYKPYELVKLTELGREVARNVRQRHSVIKTFLEEVLLVSPDKADSDACRIEHGVSADTIYRMAALRRFLNSPRMKREKVVEEFKQHLAEEK